MIFLTMIVWRGGRINQRTLAQFREHRRCECVPRTNHSAANHKHVEVQHVHQVSQQNSQSHTEAAEDLRLAMRALGRITGTVRIDELLDVIFRDFCIGK